MVFIDELENCVKDQYKSEWNVIKKQWFVLNHNDPYELRKEHIIKYNFKILYIEYKIYRILNIFLRFLYSIFKIHKLYSI